ncbi:MAG: helix-turn-helix domain-containing protein [Pseudonocardiaceae bacterium]
MRAALAARDVGRVYRLLRRVGVSQRRIGALTDQSQSEVCEILKGRQVLNVRVLERIADGLGVPRERIGLSYGKETPDPSSVAEEMDEDVKRRALVATISTATLGEPLFGMGKPIEPAWASGQVVPAQLDLSHVHMVRAVTERLRFPP